MAKREMRTRNTEEVKIEKATEVEQETINVEKESKKGVVVNCLKLNVRKAPTKGSEVLYTVNKGEELEIIVDEYAKGWYKVSKSDHKACGYCMSEYVKVN